MSVRSRPAAGCTRADVLRMKIIFSRKGFDSSYGGVPSPILGGQVISLPIPEPRPHLIPPGGGVTYAQIHATAKVPTGRLVNDLTGGRVSPQAFAHLDPDLDPANVPRRPGWQPLFGQTGTAERHLQNQRVGPGDVFLFFGWFREVVFSAGKFQYQRGATNLHVCFGWLQIQQRLQIAPPPASALPPWSTEHPHHKAVPYGSPDSIYTATQSLSLPGLSVNLPGAGVLDQFDPKRCLTAPTAPGRIYWQLPAWFYPPSAQTALTYHSDLTRWHRGHGGVVLKTVCQGQEFVLDCNHYPSAIPWLANLLI